MRLCLPLLVGLACLLPPALASAQGAKQQKRVALGLDAARGLSLLGDGFVRVHFTSWENKSPPTLATANVIDVKKGERISVELPVADLAGKWKEAFYDGSPLRTVKSGRTLGDVEIEPIGYDGKELVAVLRQYRFGPKVSEGYAKQRYLIARWDLESKSVTAVSTLADLEKGSWLRHFGLTRDGKAIWFYVDRGADGTRRVQVHRYDLEAKAAKVVATVELPLREKRHDLHAFASRDHAKLAILEYSEQGDGVLSPPAKGAIVDTASGKSVTFDVPVTPYGVDFDGAGKRLAVGSNQAATLQLFDAETGKQLAKIKGAKYVHLLAFSKSDRWIYTLASNLGGKTLDAYAVPSLKKKSLPVGKIVPGSQCFDAEGSVLAPDRSWVATWASGPKNKLCWADKTAVDIITLD